ncbi:MAG: RNA-binding protein, partial [Bacteroidetes bacterium]
GGDFDNDGDVDYVVGNLGLNSDYKAGPGAPVQLYSGYFDNNRSWDAILCNYNLDEDDVHRSFPAHFRNDLIGHMASIQKIFPDFESYATASIHDILATDQLDSARILSAHTLQSAYIENLGDGGFVMHPLSIEAQISPIHGMLVRDVNNDGDLDVICTANFYGADVRTGRYDASRGMCLIGNGEGAFRVAQPAETGFFNIGDSRALIGIEVEDKSIVIAASNKGGATSYILNNGDPKSTYIPKLTESSATLVFHNGVRRKHEFYYGSGYLSQSSRAWRIPLNATVQSSKDNE